jgi:hypothetical protein
MEKNTGEICFLFFDQKLRFTYSQAFKKDGQVTGEASASKTSSTSNHEILKLFSIFRAIFALLDLDPDCPDPDPDSDPDLDPDNTGMIIKDE